MPCLIVEKTKKEGIMEALMNVSYQALSDENSETFLIKKAINGDAESFTELMKIYKMDRLQLIRQFF